MLKDSKASVTKNGVIFQRKKYSCSYAIKNKWFERALISGIWKIEIIYEPRDLSEIWIILENKMILIKALMILKYPITIGKKRAYYEKINQLKKRRGKKSLNTI